MGGGPISFPETSATIYPSSLCDVPQKLKPEFIVIYSKTRHEKQINNLKAERSMI